MNRTAKNENIDTQRLADAPVGWGAALIDAKGNEIPITESMIQRACEELAGSWRFPHHHTTATH